MVSANASHVTCRKACADTLLPAPLMRPVSVCFRYTVRVLMFQDAFYETRARLSVSGHTHDVKRSGDIRQSCSDP